MSGQKYTFGDLVKWTQTGQAGVVKAVHHDSTGFVYGVHVKSALGEVLTDLPEAELELVKLANEDETGMTPNRYVT